MPRRSHPPLFAAFAVAVAMAGAGCVGYTEVRKQCPDCIVVSRFEPTAPIAPGTRTLYLLVPGILGFGWEWDEPIATLRRVPDGQVQVFEWRPSSPLGRVAGDLAATVNGLWREAPDTVDRIVVVGHSAGGLVTAHAAARFQVPSDRRMLVVNVGAPYAGLGVMGDGPVDYVWAPFGAALGMCFGAYPAPAQGVEIESWVTNPRTDPVMKPRFGHRPDDPRVGPPGRRVLLPEDADHNHFLADVTRDVAARYCTVGAAATVERPPAAR